MKAIINMDDLLKKNTIKLDVSLADNEDLTSKLQVSHLQIVRVLHNNYSFRCNIDQLMERLQDHIHTLK